MREEPSEPDVKSAPAAERYDYPECLDAPFAPSWNGWEEAADVAVCDASVGGDGAHRERGISPELERKLEEERRRAFESGRAQGREEGQTAERAAQAESVARANDERARQAAQLAEGFAEERERYFRAADRGVAKLALAAAARILRREAETDPLLLMGAVRAALGQISAATEVRLKVPPAELELWTEAIALLPHLSLKPKIEAAAEMQAGDCRIETNLGSADLGVRAQLAEMERALLGAPGGDAGKPVQAEPCGVHGEAGR